MEVVFLGSGTSTGNPEIGCKCSVCQSSDPKDRRMRASVLLQVDGQRILIDCGPDFREQILDKEFLPIDAVLITHEHYDHVGGIDDLRPFCKFKNIEIYSNQLAINALKTRMPYCFRDDPYPGVPSLNLHTVSLDNPFSVGSVQIQPVGVMHLNLPIYGYRIGNFAYLTDVKHIPESEYEKLNGLDVLVMSALRKGNHISHQNLDDALENVKRIAPKKAYFIHMSHGMGLHQEVQSELPPNVHLAYDGLVLNI